MLRHLVAFSVRFRGVILALGCLAVGYGTYVASRSQLDVFPDFAPPLIVIQTEAVGLSPEEVENLITRPIENAVNGVAGLETLRSQSIQGLSVVTAIFREGTDILRARQLVNERMAEVARSLPQGSGAPVMAPLTSATSLVLVAGLVSNTRSLRDLRTLADYDLKPRLLAVPGVAKVVVFGGEIRQFQIRIHPQKLKDYGISFQELAEAAARATGVRGAGFIETSAQRLIVRTEGQALTAQELAKAVARRSQGLEVTLSQLAEVTEGFEPKTGDAQIMGRPGVLLVISGQYGANTLEVTRALESVFKELKPLLEKEDVQLLPNLFRPANFIVTAIRKLRSSLLVGGFLVCAVLCLFLWNASTAFISLTAIPLSLLVAVVILDRLGISLNTLTLGGLAIALGGVVDDAIIDVENIFRRLKENARRQEPVPRLGVVVEASLEVRSAVVYATLVVILVFMPVISLSGIQGKLFAPLGWAYIFSTLASLFVALMLTPALSSVLLGKQALAHEGPPWVTRLKRLYPEWLASLLDRPRRVIGIAAALCVAAVAALPFFGGSFLPEFREGHFIVHMSAIPGTSLQESMRLGQRMTQALLELPEVKSVSQQAGRAEQSDDTWGVHYSEIHVDLKPMAGEEAEAVQSKIRTALVRFPGAYFAIKPFLTERMEETISGLTAQVAVKIFGNNLDLLDQKAKEVAQLLAKIPGAVDVQIESQASVPEVHIRLRADKLREHGFQPTVVLDAVQTAYQGAKVSQVFEGNRVFDVVALLDESIRQNPENIGEMALRNPDGAWVLLRELAEIKQGTGRYVVTHENTRRRQSVTCNVAGRDLDSFVNDLKKSLRGLDFPSGTYPVVSGAAEAKSKGQRDLLVHSLLAAGGIVLLLWMVFENGRNLLLVLANLPFALVGGVLAVFFTGGWLSLGSLVGFVTLFGISTRNSIMLVSHYEHLVHSEGMTWGREAAIRGAVERLVPILMTALVTGLGLLPIAIGTGSAGREIEGPMAIVILGGLLSSTVLNLLLLPTLALRFGRFAEK